jgi:putative sugar O-methyltransferase
MKDDTKLLNLMMKDMSQQKEIYKPGPYWMNSAIVAAQKMESHGILNFRSHLSGSIGQGYTGCLILDPSIVWNRGRLPRRILKKILDNKLVRKYVIKYFTDKIESYEDQLSLYRDYFINSSLKEWLNEIIQKYNLPESMVGGCETTVRINNKPFSIHYLEAIARIYNFSSRIDFTKIDSVFEIGGGFGCNAHLLIHLFPNIMKYLYLDIPPNLYVGTQYLKHFFPSSVVDYKELSNKDIINFSNKRDLEILAIAPWQLEKTEAHIDCFWNSASFVEMPLDVVHNYAKYIDSFVKKDLNSFLCLLSYDGFDLSTTFHPDKLIEIFGTNFHVERIKPLINTSIDRENYYYLGKRKL